MLFRGGRGGGGGVKGGLVDRSAPLPPSSVPPFFFSTPILFLFLFPFSLCVTFSACGPGGTPQKNTREERETEKKKESN